MFTDHWMQQCLQALCTRFYWATAARGPPLLHTDVPTSDTHKTTRAHTERPPSHIPHTPRTPKIMLVTLLTFLPGITPTQTAARDISKHPEFSVLTH